MSKRNIKSYCSLCNHETNHNVLCQYDETHRGDYSYDLEYQIIECLGCNKKAFRQVFEDVEAAYQISETEWEVPKEIEIYPKFIKNHTNMDGEHYLPEIVGSIYKEVLIALQEDANILASLGLRGTVEAVCNNLGITGKNLEIRISKLATAGYISKKDSDRLHGIRFMGNDSAHEIKKPKSTQLSVALKIVEHLLLSVYILEKQVDGKIDTTINDFNKFEELLKKRIKLLVSNNELPLIGIFDTDYRRIKESIFNLEKELIDKINSGEITYLSLGKNDKYNNYQNNLQYYIIK
ncbi:DUF4145 domain-containing protein [Aliarcobacter cryaerophilus]|uniref:DUF4145 domain-containing protein n=1 Tax=Aliarcobacter cryaerophilus TaxID=28198 RepID=UPI003DA6AF47